MESKKIIIQNRNGKKLVMLVDTSKNQKGIAFVLHGLGGFKEQPLIRTIAESLKQHDYSVITFDTTNGIGESEGSFEDATTTGHIQDLEDVISWAKTQKWYQEPFILAGHSLGGIAVIYYSEEHPNEVKALAPLSTIVSGKLSIKYKDAKNLEEWKRTGWKISESRSKPGVIKKLKWSHIEDRLKYNILSGAGKLKIPVLLCVGDKDIQTPIEHQKIIYDALPREKELHIIKGAEHTFKEKEHLEELKKIFDNWLDKII